MKDKKEKLEIKKKPQQVKMEDLDKVGGGLLPGGGSGTSSCDGCLGR